MKNVHDLPALQQQADKALRQHFAAWPAPTSADTVQLAGRAAVEAPSWFDGQPARRLLAYLHRLQEACHIAPGDAGGELVVSLIEDECARLLVLHPTRRAERLATYALRIGFGAGWGIDRDRSNDVEPGDIPRLCLVDSAPALASPYRIHLKGPTQDEALKFAADELLRFWWWHLKAGRIDELDRPPGLPAGAVLGILEADAQRLWPALSSDIDAVSATPAADATPPTGVRAKRKVGKPASGLPSDVELARELADEESRQRHGAMARLVVKYGYHRSTLQRHVKAGKDAVKTSFFPRVVGAKR